MLIDHHVDNTIEQELSPPIPELKSSDVRSWVHYGRDPRHPLTAGIILAEVGDRLVVRN